jgi:hypothetical protein
MSSFFGSFFIEFEFDKSSFSDSLDSSDASSNQLNQR